MLPVTMSCALGFQFTFKNSSPHGFQVLSLTLIVIQDAAASGPIQVICGQLELEVAFKL
jgi:hypothetical protein